MAAHREGGGSERKGEEKRGDVSEGLLEHLGFSWVFLYLLLLLLLLLGLFIFILIYFLARPNQENHLRGFTHFNKIIILIRTSLF